MAATRVPWPREPRSAACTPAIRARLHRLCQRHLLQQKTSAVSKLKLAGPVSPELGAMARVTWLGEGLPRMAGAHLRDLKLAELRRAQRLRHSSCAHCATASHPVCRVPNMAERHRGISPLRLHRALSERLFGCWLSWVTYGVRYDGLTSAWAPIPCPLRGHTLSYARIGRNVAAGRGE